MIGLHTGTGSEYALALEQVATAHATCQIVTHAQHTSLEQQAARLFILNHACSMQSEQTGARTFMNILNRYSSSWPCTEIPNEQTEFRSCIARRRRLGCGIFSSAAGISGTSSPESSVRLVPPPQRVDTRCANCRSVGMYRGAFVGVPAEERREGMRSALRARLGPCVRACGERGGLHELSSAAAVGSTPARWWRPSVRERVVFSVFVSIRCVCALGRLCQGMQ